MAREDIEKLVADFLSDLEQGAQPALAGHGRHVIDQYAALVRDLERRRADDDTADVTLPIDAKPLGAPRSPVVDLLRWIRRTRRR